jgi:transcriptional regulator GlxA family with amidase domain
MTTFGLLIFDEAEELDFCGPWEVFTSSSMLRDFSDQVVLIAEHPDPVRCGKGMKVIPDHTLADAPPLDLLLVPGGFGTRREVFNTKLIDWITRTSATVTWVTSVCTGALLLHEAGVARGRRVATHHAFEDTLQARGDVTVVRDARYVVDGNLVTSRVSLPASTWLCG